MKTIVSVLALAALVSAVPKPTQLHFRNAFKPPVGNIQLKPNPRIIGGEEAEPHSIPYQVFLEVLTEDEGWYCGGVLISENYVLSAGHCGVDAEEAYVTLGAHTITEDEDTQVTVHSTVIKVHEDYNDDLILNDVSVIKFPRPVTLTEAIQPATLPTRADAENRFTGDTARISGWGLTDGFGNKLSSVLKIVDVKVISNRECEDYFGELPESNICTSGDDNTGSCNGDSGGPLTVDGKLVGIVSFGIIFCLYGFPSAFSRVTSFLDWIEVNTDVQIK